MQNAITPRYPRVLRGTTMAAFLIALLLLISAASGHGQTVIATVPVGPVPIRMAVNAATNKIYVANQWDTTCGHDCPPPSITVIDGATNNSTTEFDDWTVFPWDLAVNPVTNKIYVESGPGYYTSDDILVIDGATNTITTTVTDPNASGPYHFAVNSVTNKIYVANSNSDNVTVIDGATNATTTITDPNAIGPHFVAVNPATNKIYVANWDSGNVTVIDGATNLTSTVLTGTNPNFVAVNPVTNKIYVPNSGSGTVTVIDGVTNSATTLRDPNSDVPKEAAVNQVTNKIYVTNYESNNITVIDGATNSTTTVKDPNAIQPIGVAVNSVTNKIYVANWASSNVTVIDGATNSTSTVTSYMRPTQQVDLNPKTNRIYALSIYAHPDCHWDGCYDNKVTVIAGGGNAPGLAPSSLSFGPQPVGTFSSAQQATLKNTGGAALKINSISRSGDFYQGNDCPSTLPAGASCRLTVWFTPTSAGTRSGTVTICDNVPGSPHKLPLSGTGSGTGSISLTLSPASLSFGSVVVGASSSPQTVTLTNTGTVAAKFLCPFGFFAIQGTNWLAFHEQPNCGSSLAPKASCKVSVFFQPLTSGTKTGYFVVRQGAASVQIPLRGTGTP